MELTLKECERIIKYIINNNQKLQERGEKPIAVNICGPAGYGKSAVARQIAQELDANFIFLSLSHLTDPAELCGWPVKEHYVCKEDDCCWITGELVEAYTKAGYTITEDTRMGYAVPAWLKGLDPNKITVCVLDDYTRATPQILQAAMSITYEQEYISWKLPKNTTVLLTTNPDNSEFLVNSLDEAQMTRFVTLNMKFSIEDWLAYAAKQGIDGRCQNFLGLHWQELMDRSVAKTSKINARSYTMFANIISGIDDWSTPENLAFIVQIASGCFNDEDNIVGGLFSNFIANKLDKLISPEDLVNGKWEHVKSLLEDQLYDGDVYRADIASVITTRFINYSLLYFSKAGADINLICNRILELVENDKILLTEDLLFNLIYQLNIKYPVKVQRLVLNPKISKRLM